MKKYVFTLFICIAALAACAQGPLADVPYHSEEELIFIRVMVNDSEELNFMFDTGAGVTVLNASVADRLGLTYTGTARIGTGGNTMQSRSSAGNTISIGRAVVQDLTFEVFTFDHLSRHFDISVDGIIGYDLMSRYIVETDPRAERLRLYAQEAFTAPAGYKEQSVYKK